MQELTEDQKVKMATKRHGYRTVIPTEKDIARFMSKIAQDEDGCWYWLGHTASSDGYGRFYIQGGQMVASRVAYIIGTGKQIPIGQLVAHTCDNPSCVNPTHLFLATDKENSLDRDKKGRTIQQVITQEQVIEIYKRIDNNEAFSIIAKDYPIGYHGIYRIARGMTWKWLYQQWKGGGF